MKRILDEYGRFSKEELAACTTKLKKRLGDLRLREALASLESGEFESWLGILMDYYDKTYLHSLNERRPVNKMSLSVGDTDCIPDTALRLIALKESIKEQFVS
jgi:tRNA 2-selenouridine synthase